jgi:hypothetical protein
MHGLPVEALGVLILRERPWKCEMSNLFSPSDGEPSFINHMRYVSGTICHVCSKPTRNGKRLRAVDKNTGRRSRFCARFIQDQDLRILRNASSVKEVSLQSLNVDRFLSLEQTLTILNTSRALHRKVRLSNSLPTNGSTKSHNFSKQQREGFRIIGRPHRTDQGYGYSEETKIRIREWLLIQKPLTIRLL